MESSEHTIYVLAKKHTTPFYLLIVLLVCFLTLAGINVAGIFEVPKYQPR